MRHLFLILCFSALLYHVSSLNSDGVTLLSLMKRWKFVPPAIKSSWNNTYSTPCSWVGIGCNEAHHVDFINLTGYPISGQVGPEIGHLIHLRTLVFSHDGLSGEIPAEVGNCTNLKFLDLSENNLSGKIPVSLKNLQKLKKLILYSNMLVGEISESLFQIPHLEHVMLYNNNLSGPIPKSVENLTELSWLHLERNKLSGTIPSSIGNCTKLKELFLNDNHLQGVLPESLNNLENLAKIHLNDNDFLGIIPLGSGKCQNLLVLALSYNVFSGGIPKGLGNCTALTKLSIVHGNLHGRIPRELGNCKSLGVLELQENNFEGEIPDELGKLSELRFLSLNSNNLTGEIPLSIWEISSLEAIYVNGNNLVGELPIEMSDHKQLKIIHLYGNQLSGVIPQSLGTKSSLEELDFTNNKFSGNIPPNLCYKKQLVLLLMGQNQLLGRIPLDIGRCPTLQRLILKENNLSGTLPEFERNTYLHYVNISVNKISGEIPSSLGNCTNLTDVDLSMNKLNGQIPSELGHLVNLGRVDFSNNNLKGPLPPQLSNCNKMLYFDVGFNSLNGSFPSSLRSWTELTTLVLRENQFSGGIPNFLLEFEQLSLLEIGGNKFGGRIPRSIGALRNLMYGLNLSANGLVGEIPLEIAKLKMLQNLDISLNNLTGSIEVLDELSSLVEINVSYNSFDGPVPRSLMKFLNSPSSFLGNSGLCVSCLTSNGLNCYKNSNLKPCDNKSTQKRHPGKIKLIIISIGSSIFFVVLLLCLLYMFLRKFKYNQRSLSILKKVMKATKNLNDHYIIGRGAHGVVYRVQLGPNKIFALKKLQFAENERQTQSMINEIETLAKIRHRNLVKLKNFWFRKDYGLILYNYMQNGSLHDVLHGMNSPPFLKWSIRHQIAMGIAHGLSYLHHDCDPVIVHQDIKPKNILLDSDMEPHIGDFGISKLLDQSSTSTSSVSVAGTLGYIAPETAYTTRKSTKSDVYSYGVVLLEVLTRKEVLDSSFCESQDMVGWVRNIWEKTGDVTEIVDHGLANEVASNPNAREQVNQVLLVALRCTEKDAVKRPTMRDVVNQLIFK